MRVNGIAYRTVWLDGSTVKMVDQRQLPFAFAIASLPTCQDTAEAIRNMTVRGAGAIGVAAGFAVAQAALTASAETFEETVAQAASTIRSTRPTAQNLFYAVDRVMAAMTTAGSMADRREAAVKAAQAIADEDAEAARRIGEAGQPLLPDPAHVLTHCNAGWLAFADWGTALSPVYCAHRAGRRVSVYATETRPRGQGARLTAWELTQEGIACTLIADTAVGHLMRQGAVNIVIVGADRIAANGDVANKIGTYQLAVLAKTHGIPFYVAAPTMTIDWHCPSGAAIPIEERSGDEVCWVDGETEDGRRQRVRVTAQVAVRNWAFDVTPASYITGLITEGGVIAADTAAIGGLVQRAVSAAGSGRR